MSTDKPVTYFIELGGERLPLREVGGTEHIAKPFCLEARFRLAAGRDVDPDALVKSQVKLLLVRDSLVRKITGVVTDVAVGAVMGGEPEVIVVVEPRMALSRFRSDLRVFRNMTVPEMVVDVLSQIGVAPSLRLTGAYERRPYTVQMRETDFHFVSRLMEEEGIFYFFTADDVMVMGDHHGAYDALPGDRRIPYRAGSDLDRNADEISEVGGRAALSVGKVSLRDWNAETPSLDMDVAAAGPSPAGPEYYDYPGEYLAPPQGARIAQLMAEAYARNSEGLIGKTTCGRFGPGFTFELQDSPRGVSDGGYVITQVVHGWHRQSGGFMASFEALADNLTYRPPRIHEEPVLPNPLTGVVTGPPGQDDIYTDEHGRVKVHFPWDRRLPADDDCSHWIPVLQNNTGHSVSLPRIGWEVLCHFQEGDPDRPIVLGRLFNGADAIHIELPRDKTRSSIKSLSSPTRDGTNEIQFEDQGDREHVWVHAEKDQNIVVANDFTEDITVDESVKVDNDESITIGNDHTAEIGSHLIPIIDGNQTWSVGGNRKRTIDNSDIGDVVGNRTVTIGGSHNREVGIDCSTEADTDLKEQIAGVALETSDKANATECADNMTMTVGGMLLETAKQEKTETAGKERQETIGGSFFLTADEEIKTRANKPLSSSVGASMKVTSTKTCALTGAEKFDAYSATGQHTAAASITLKVKDTSVQLKDGLVMIKAPSAIKLTISGANTLGASKSNQN